MCRPRSRPFSAAEGIAVRTGAECISFAKRGNQLVARTCTASRARRKSSARTCCWPSAAGPTPTIWGSSAPESQLDQRGYIVVDEELRTNVPGIWALGDCNGRGAFTHTAYNDFEIVADNLLDGRPSQVTDRIALLRPFRRSAAGARRTYGSRGARCRQKNPRRQAADDPRQPRCGKGRVAGIHEGHRRCRHRPDPGRRHPRGRRRRGGACIMDTMSAKAPVAR